MADPRQVSEVLAHLRGVYSKPESWPNEPGRTAWETQFATVPDVEMWKAIHAALRDVKHHTFPPTPMSVLALVEVQTGVSAHGPSDPLGCPDCAVLCGYREMAVQWIDGQGKAGVRYLTAACECRLGDVRRAAGALPGRETWERWETAIGNVERDGGQFVGLWRTDREHPRLTDEQRQLPEWRGRYPAKPRSAAVALLMATMRGTDEHSRERARNVAREQGREEMEEAS